MNVLENLYVRYPQLTVCRAQIAQAYELLLTCFRQGGKVLVCGNGGSAADTEHIVGELMKSFRVPRPIDPDVAVRLPPELCARLEGALPAISLVSMTGILTAFANDRAWDMAYAQLTYGLGKPGDVLIALSTSGNSANCVNAVRVARAKEMSAIALTGATGGALGTLADVTLSVPEMETYKVQELHLCVYHALCASLEQTLFASAENKCKP